LQHVKGTIRMDIPLVMLQIM